MFDFIVARNILYFVSRDSGGGGQACTLLEPDERRMFCPLIGIDQEALIKALCPCKPIAIQVP